MPTPTPDDSYWADYDGLQAAKHQILKRYLAAWFPILASANSRILYVDCHAGRGRHDTGQEGSPLLALRILREHSALPRILGSSQVCFHFFEHRRDNCDHLRSEVAQLGVLPRQMKVHIHNKDYESELGALVRQMNESGYRLAPAFAFVDPFGFTLSMKLLNNLLAFQKCEILINFMYRYVDMAMHNPDQQENLDALFGCTV